MRQGDRGNNFYLVKDGQCEVVVEKKDSTATVVRRLAAGSSCGEMAILNDAPRSATVSAVSETVTVLIVNRRTFVEMIGNACAAKRKKYVPFLNSVDVLANCSDYERLTIADILTPRSFEDGETVLRRDVANDRFWMVTDGEVVSDHPEVTYGRGDYFGEVELFK
ncbi:cyclic nucleotide-binding-like protein [Pavlovales sp. CCMP2436]|nr:cyclic nucleotide-binding-like protein [Pavlovales sp. CCMP2436]